MGLSWGVARDFARPRPAELDAALLRPLPALARPGADQVALEIGQPAKNRQHEATGGARCVPKRPSTGGSFWRISPGLTGLRECVSFSAMGPRSKQPVVICPRCRRRMATKEHKPVGPKQRKAIKFSDSLVEVAYVCESCGTEIKRTIREK